MKKYIFVLIFGFGIVLHGQTVYAQAVDKNILANQELMGTITPEQVEKYIANGGDVNARDNKYGVTVLMAVAIAGQNPEVIETLLKHGANIKTKNKDGVTALMYAAANNQHPEIIETLIKHGANVNAKAEAEEVKGWTPLIMAAVSNPNSEVIETLLRHGANIEAKIEGGVTVLMFAAVNNQNPEIIDALLKHGANIEAKTEDGETALMVAAANNQNPEVIGTLIDNGAIIRDGNQLLELLDENENIEKNQDYWDLRDRIYDEINR